MEQTKSNWLNTYLFLKYLIANGFNPNNYEGILELGQSAPKSLSRFLTEYKQFLLSRKVDYGELEQHGIRGAYGYIDNNKIFVPKTIESDEHFLTNGPKVPYQRHGYDYPSLQSFGAIICEGYSEDLVQALSTKQDKYFGFCRDIIENDNKQQDFSSLLNAINHLTGENYELLHDADSKQGKVLLLIKKKQ